MLNKYLSAFSIYDLAKASDWLDEKGELFVEAYPRYGGGGEYFYFIRTLQDLRLLILQYGGGITYSIYCDYPPSLRGIANKDFLEHALGLFPEGHEFYIAQFVYYPDQSHYLGHGSSHAVLLREVAEEWGSPLSIGPKHHVHGDGIYEGDRVQVDVSHPRPSQTPIYAPYDANPTRYQWIVDMWRE